MVSLSRKTHPVVIPLIVFGGILIAGHCLFVAAFFGWLYTNQRRYDSQYDAARKQIRKLDLAVKKYMDRHNGKRPADLQQLFLKDDFGDPILKNQSELFAPWGLRYEYDPTGIRNNGARPDIWVTAHNGLIIGNWESNK